MKRCLDCGADRTADQCPACGLTSAAAELVVRRRLVRRTAFFLVGIIVFVAASQVFPALEIDAILIFAGLVFFFSLALGYWIDLRARKREEVEVIKRIYFGMIPVPWIFAGMLFLNGKLGYFASDSRFRRQSLGSSRRMVCRAAAAWWLRPGVALGGSNASRWIKMTTIASRGETTSLFRRRRGPLVFPGSTVYTARSRFDAACAASEMQALYPAPE